jgi:type II secretory pathway component PulF
VVDVSVDDRWISELLGETQVMGDRQPEVMVESLQWRLAVQWAPLRWRRSLTELAVTLENGVALEDAIRQHRSAAPGELRSLWDTSLRLPSPSKFVLQSLTLRAQASMAAKRLLEMAIYPFLLLVVSLIITFLLCTILEQLVSDVHGELGLAGQAPAVIRDQRSAVAALLAMLGWCALLWLTFRSLGPPWAWSAIAGGIPYFGKTFRWLSLFEMIGRLDSLWQQGLSGQAANESLAHSFLNGRQAAVASVLAVRAQRGVPLGTALAECTLSDGFCAPILLTLNSSSINLVSKTEFSRLSEVTQLLIRMAEARNRFLGLLIPVLIFVLIGSIVWGVLSSYLEVLVSLIRWMVMF